MSLFGRADELAVIARSIGTQATRAVVVTGEPGAGKTALLASSLAVVSDRRILALRGYQPESLAPLAAASDLIRELAAANGKLARLLQGDGPADLMFLFEAVHHAIEADPRPVIFVVDDVQWLDEMTRGLLHYLVRAAHHDGRDVLLLAAGRPSAELGALHEALLTLLGEQLVSSVELRPLDRNAGVDLIHELRPDLSAAAAAELWSLAGGSPFWLRMVAQDGGHAATANVVRARLRACSADAATAVGALAVAARPLPPVALAEMLQWYPGRTDAAISSLLDRGLANRHHSNVTLAHDLVREAVTADLPLDVQRDLHARIGAWLSQDESPATLLAAMHHLRSADQPVISLALRILASPRKRWLGAAGISALRALTDSDRGPEMDALLVQLAELATEMGEPNLALPLWEQCFAAADTSHRRAQAAREVARAAYQLDDAERAWRWLRVARDLCVGDEAAEVGVIVLEAHLLRWMDGRFTEAADAAGRALTRARCLPSPEHRDVLVESLAVTFDDAMGRGDFIAIAKVADEVEEVARGDADLEYTAAFYRMSALRLVDEPRSLEALARRHWQNAIHSGHFGRALEMSGALVDALTRQARLNDAVVIVAEIEPSVARASDLGRRFSTGISLTHVLREVDLVHAITGEWRAAVDRIVAGVDDAGLHLGMTSAALAADLVLMLGGGAAHEEAKALCQRTLAMSEEVGCRRCGEETGLRVARVLALAGDSGAARTALATWGPAPGELRPDHVQRWHRLALALVDAVEGQPDLAAESIADVAAEYAALGAELEALWTLLDLSQVIGAADPQRAVAVLQDVARRTTDGGATNLGLVAQRRLRELGARPWRRGRSVATGLTERESDVARLLATGATNPEIAGQLFLSRKTVERHVSNVISKLHVRNRAEVAALIAAEPGSIGGANRGSSPMNRPPPAT